MYIQHVMNIIVWLRCPTISHNLVLISAHYDFRQNCNLNSLGFYVILIYSKFKI